MGLTILDFPPQILRHIQGENVSEVHLGKSHARVFQVGDDLYLKTQEAGSGAEPLRTEYRVMTWLEKTSIQAPWVLEYLRETETEYLMMSAIPGQPASESRFAEKAVKTCGQALRMIHDTLTVADCPFDRRLGPTLDLCRSRVQSGVVDEGDFDPERLGKSATWVLEEIERQAPDSEDLVVCHGDYCLPNIILNADVSLSGFIDLGSLGVADRHFDLALASRSIAKNFGQESVEIFYTSYGIQPRPELIHFYQMVDELF